MRTIYRKDGIKLNDQGSITIGEIQYPSAKNAFERGAEGVTQAMVDDFPDLNLFDVQEDLAGNLTITLKPQVELDKISNRQIQQQIDALEQQCGIVRGVREFMIYQLEKEAIALGAAQNPPLAAATSLAYAYSTNILYKNAKDLNTQIEALRAQLIKPS